MQNHLAQHGAIVAGGVTVYGITPEQFAGYAAAAYSFVATAYTLWKWWQDIKAKRAAKQ